MIYEFDTYVETELAGGTLSIRDELVEFPRALEMIEMMGDRIEELESELMNITLGINKKDLNKAREILCREMPEHEAIDIMEWDVPETSRVSDVDHLDTPVVLTRVTAGRVGKLLGLSTTEAVLVLKKLNWTQDGWPQRVNGKSGRWWFPYSHPGENSRTTAEDRLLWRTTGYATSLTEGEKGAPNLEGLF